MLQPSGSLYIYMYPDGRGSHIHLHVLHIYILFRCRLIWKTYHRYERWCILQADLCLWWNGLYLFVERRWSTWLGILFPHHIFPFHFSVHIDGIWQWLPEHVLEMFAVRHENCPLNFVVEENHVSMKPQAVASYSFHLHWK